MKKFLISLISLLNSFSYSDFIIETDNLIINPISVININNQYNMIFSSVHTGLTNHIGFYGQGLNKIIKNYNNLYPNGLIELNNNNFLVYGKNLTGYEKSEGFLAIFNNKLELEKIKFYKITGSRETDIIKCLNHEKIMCVIYSNKKSQILETDENIFNIKIHEINNKIQITDFNFDDSKIVIIGKSFSENGDNLKILELDNNIKLIDEKSTLFENKRIYPSKLIIKNKKYYILNYLRPLGYYGNNFEKNIIIKKNNDYKIEKVDFENIFEIENKIIGVKIDNDRIVFEDIDNKKIKKEIKLDEIGKNEKILKIIINKDIFYVTIASEKHLKIKILKNI
ncbi:MAG TPA: hypothetical protein PKW55_00495 [Spirochaetota bacterium]|nr:hypothetical protein [Spirochaetota bacterium]HOM37834.1 hypothetical protein [Spirochaetota bacterium]HPQ49289.1 hypothetical protein [Spirochaetota bacterium]